MLLVFCMWQWPHLHTDSGLDYKYKFLVSAFTRHDTQVSVSLIVMYKEIVVSKEKQLLWLF